MPVDTLAMAGIGLAVVVVVALAVLIAVLFHRLGVTRAELGERVDEADERIHKVKVDLRDYADEMDAHVTTGRVDAAQVDARDVHSESVKAEREVSAGRFALDHAASGPGMVLSMAPPRDEPLGSLPGAFDAKRLVHGAPHPHRPPPMAAKLRGAPPPPHPPTVVPPLKKPMPPMPTKPAAAPKALLPKPASPLKPSAAAAVRCPDGKLLTKNKDCVTNCVTLRDQKSCAADRACLWGAYGCANGPIEHYRDHHSESDSDGEACDDPDKMHKHKKHHEHGKHHHGKHHGEHRHGDHHGGGHREKETQVTNHHHQFHHPPPGGEQTAAAASWLARISGAAAASTAAPPPPGAAAAAAAAAAAKPAHPPAPAPPKPKPPVPGDGSWMYMVDPAGSRLFKGGLAASTAWFRDGVQVSPGKCISEGADGGGAMCFESSGASVGSAGKNDKKPNVVRVWDALHAQHVHGDDSIGVGGVRMTEVTHPGVGGGSLHKGQRALHVDAGLTTAGPLSATGAAEFGSSAEFHGAADFRGATSFGGAARFGGAADFGRPAHFGAAADFGGEANFRGATKFARPAELAHGAVSDSDGYYAAGAPGAAPIVARVAKGAKGAAWASAGLIEDSKHAGDLRVFSKDSVALSTVDPSGNSRGGPNDLLVASARDGTWVRDRLSVTHAGDGRGLVLADDGGIEYVPKMGSKSTAAAWRTGIWEQARQPSSFVIESVSGGGKSKTPMLSATAGAGVGVMLPRGTVPQAALDVAGGARFSGSLCVGSTCMSASDFAAIAALPPRISALSATVTSQGQQITAQGQQIAGQGQQITSQGTQISSHDQTLTVHGNQIGTHDRTLTSQGDQLGTQGQALTGLQQSVAQQIQQLNAQIAQLQQSLNSQMSQDQQAQAQLAQQMAAVTSAQQQAQQQQQQQLQQQQAQLQQQQQQQAQQQQLQQVASSTALPSPILDFDASALSPALVGTPVTSWTNTGSMSGSTYAAAGSGSAVPTLVASPSTSTKNRPYVTMTANGSLSIPGTITWTLQSNGYSFVAIFVARVNQTSAASTFVEFATGPQTNSLAFSQDGSGQLVGSMFGAQSGLAAQTSTTAPGGVVATAKWAVYAVRMTPAAGSGSSGGYSITHYLNGVVSTTGSGTAALADRTTTINVINASSAGSAGGSAVDLAELLVYNAPMTDAQVTQVSQQMIAKWIS